MNRRGFLGGLAALGGGLAVAEAIPLGRVWSFPSKITPVNVVISSYADYMSFSDLTLYSNLHFDEILKPRTLPPSDGRTIRFQ